MKIESVYIELTNLCNLNCKTCYNRSGLSKTKKQLSTELVLDAIKLFRSYGAKSILLSGGETMLYDGITSLLDAAADMPDMPFTVSTNGTARTDVLLDYYRRVGSVYVQVSLDGSCEEINSRTRGKGNFEKTIALLEGMHDSDRPVGYRMKMVVSKYNLDDIPAYFDLAVKFGCEPRFSFMNPLGNGGDNWNEMGLSASEKMTALRLIDSCNRKYSTKVELPFCAFSCPFKEAPAEMKLGCMVKVNGDIMPCQAMYDEQFRLGNILAFDENEVMENLAKLHNMTVKRMGMSFGCGKCMIDRLCLRGCPAEAFANSGDILGADGECEFRLRHYLKYQLRDDSKKSTV